MPYPKFVAIAPSGGRAIFTQVGDQIGGGAENLSHREVAQERDARLRANPANGGDLSTAKAYLEHCGWEVLWDGPPPRTQDNTLTFRLPSEDKLWVQAHGGSELLRRLIQDERARQD